MRAAFERYIGIDYSGAETCESSNQQDAYGSAEWLRRSDPDGTLERFFSPSLTDHEPEGRRNRRLDIGDR